MDTIFADLCEFFGIAGAPETFAEFVPWFFQVITALGLFLFVFWMIRSAVVNFARGGRL